MHSSIQITFFFLKYCYHGVKNFSEVGKCVYFCSQITTRMKPTQFLLLLVVTLAFASCQREMRSTHHCIVTDNYSLSVSGKRLFLGRQVAAVPKDTMQMFGDTVLLHEEVTSMAIALEDLSQGWYNSRERYLGKGYYVLNLELIHHLGSNHEQNFSDVLANLRDWGYISIDTIRRHHLAVVRKGTPLADYGEKMSYGTKSYNIDLPKELLADSVGETTLGEWLDGWMESILSTDNELFTFLATHGYDTVQTSPQSVQVYPSASRRYKPIWLLGL